MFFFGPRDSNRRWPAQLSPGADSRSLLRLQPQQMGDAHLRLSVHRQSRIQCRPRTGFSLLGAPARAVLSPVRGRPTTASGLPKLAQLGHGWSGGQCPLLRVQRKSDLEGGRSAFDPERAWGLSKRCAQYFPPIFQRSRRRGKMD